MSAVDIVTFGCRLNAFESEVIRGAAGQAGLADAVVVNTCAVTAEAERQARQLRYRREQLPDHLAEARPVRLIDAIGGQIDPGQHDLAGAAGDKAPCLFGDLTQRQGPARAASIGDNAEGAAMVAALLHLQIGAGSDTLTRLAALVTLSRIAGEGLNGAARGFPLPHRGRGGTLRGSEGWVRVAVALRLELRFIVEHEVDFRHRGIAVGG